jgi:DNA-nicking Smr family endonuclease
MHRMHRSYSHSMAAKGSAPIRIDLHGLTVREALTITEELVSTYHGSQRKLYLITGVGNHSIRGIARIRPAVKTFLSQQGVMYSDRDGVLVVEL